MNDSQFLQAFLPAAKGGLDNFFACLLVLPALLASAVGAKAILSKIIYLKHDDGKYINVLDVWFGSAKYELTSKTETKEIERNSLLITKNLNLFEN